MRLINGMIEDSNNGVCLKKNRHYYIFNKTISGCTYIDSLEEYNENYYTGLYVIPYINKNPNFNYNDNVLTISVNIFSPFSYIGCLILIRILFCKQSVLLV